MYVSTFSTTTATYRQRTLSRLNRNQTSDSTQKKVIKAMGLSSCQGLCITYNLHSKRFCK